jgi:hypothetical protein
MYANLLGDFFKKASGLKEDLVLVPSFKADMGVVFFPVQCKDCTASSIGIKNFRGLFVVCFQKI